MAESGTLAKATCKRWTEIPDTLEVGLTGVRREYRRQGIAAALKFHTLSYAKEHGFQAIEPGSDSANEAILALNESVGFRKADA